MEKILLSCAEFQKSSFISFSKLATKSAKWQCRQKCSTVSGLRTQIKGNRPQFFAAQVAVVLSGTNFSPVFTVIVVQVGVRVAWNTQVKVSKLCLIRVGNVFVRVNFLRIKAPDKVLLWPLTSKYPVFSFPQYNKNQ